MPLPEKLLKWAEQPGAMLSQSEIAFVSAVRAFANGGVGYGFMQQVCEWLWQESGIGAWGPEYFNARIAELERRIAELESVKFAYEAAPKQWSSARAPTMEAVQQTMEFIKSVAENKLLREAIKAAGFAVMQTSGAWSIHDVSERGKQLEADDLKRATQITDLEIENANLKAEIALSKEPMVIDESRWLDERNAGAAAMALAILEDNGRGQMGGEPCARAQKYVRDLRKSIQSLVAECALHDAEYQHVTNPEVLKTARQLLSSPNVSPT